MDISAPLWDTFEALCFIVSGLVAGCALGILFPSAWRTLRRRFYNRQLRYAWLFKEQAKHQVRYFDGGLARVAQLSLLDKAFLYAKSQVDSGNPFLVREAVGIYLEILTNEKSTRANNFSALKELSKVYWILELWEQAFETCVDLIYKYQEQEEAWDYFAGFLFHFPPSFFFQYEKRIHALLLSCNLKSLGPWSHWLAYACLDHAERFIERNQWEEARLWAHLAISRWWSTSARGRYILWKVIVLEYWNSVDISQVSSWDLCRTLAADLHTLLHIFAHTPLNPHLVIPVLQCVVKKWETCFSECMTIINNKPLQWFEILGTDRPNIQPEVKKLLFCFFLILWNQVDIQSKEQDALCSFIEALLKEMSKKMGQKWDVHQAFFSQLILVNSYSRLWPMMQMALNIHECCSCHLRFFETAWICKHCRSQETLAPLYTATDTQSLR